LKRFNNRVKIIFAGGEPMLVKNIIDTICEITKNNYVTLITNLTSSKFKEFSEKINPNNIFGIIASAHIKELEKRNLFYKFFCNYKYLKEKGFNISVQEVGHPSMVSKVKKYREYFRENGIDLKFQPFRGIWHGRSYPFSYSEEEQILFKFDRINLAKKFSHKKNQFCNAGYNVVVTDNYGNIKPCYKINENLGNIYGEIKLKKDLIKCPFDFCGTPFYFFEPILFKQAIKRHC
jgi:MoaA/NifB/PqqE/SkfB family radical SAM enzyme